MRRWYGVMAGLLSLALGGPALGGERLTPQQLAKLIQTDPSSYYLVDVRTAAEFGAREGRIQGTINLPFPRITWDAQSLQPRPGQTVVLICRSGHRSQLAMKAAERALGVPVLDLEGGMLSWWEEGLPVVSSAAEH